MAVVVSPAELGPGGTALWGAVRVDEDLDAVQEVQLLEACRAKDRLDRLDAVLRSGDEAAWAAALSQANATANLLKQLLAAMRLPDVSGKRPQFRGARGVQRPSGLKVSSLDRARAAKSG